MWTFGKNTDGELALGNNKNSLVPKQATGLREGNAKCIASSNNHTALVTPDGALLMTGSKLHNKLGMDIRTQHLSRFTPISGLLN